jgi:hypothetical protein
MSKKRIRDDEEEDMEERELDEELNMPAALQASLR